MAAATDISDHHAVPAMLKWSSEAKNAADDRVAAEEATGLEDGGVGSATS